MQALGYVESFLGWSHKAIRTTILYFIGASSSKCFFRATWILLLL